MFPQSIGPIDFLINELFGRRGRDIRRGFIFGQRRADGLTVAFPDMGGQSFDASFVSLDITSLTLTVGGVDVVINPDVPAATFAPNNGVPVRIVPLVDAFGLWLAIPFVDLPASRVHTDPSSTGRTVLTATNVDAVIDQADTAIAAKAETSSLAAVATGGDLSADKVVDGTTNHTFTAADDTKLAGIASGATVNSSDATLLARANHTGTQSVSTITGLARSDSAALTADVSKTSDATLAAETGLRVMIPGAGSWAYTAHLPISGPTNADFKVAVDAGAASKYGKVYGPSVSASAVPSTISLLGSIGSTITAGTIAATDSLAVEVFGTIVTSSSQAVDITWAQGTSQATPTYLHAGARTHVEEIL